MKDIWKRLKNKKSLGILYDPNRTILSGKKVNVTFKHVKKNILFNQFVLIYKMSNFQHCSSRRCYKYAQLAKITACLLKSHDRMRCAWLRRWRSSWQRRRRSAMTPWRLCGRSVSPVWRTPALNTTPEHAAVDLDWWDDRSDIDMYTYIHTVYSLQYIKCMGLIFQVLVGNVVIY